MLFERIPITSTEELLNFVLPPPPFFLDLHDPKGGSLKNKWPILCCEMKLVSGMSCKGMKQFYLKCKKLMCYFASFLI